MAKKRAAAKSTEKTRARKPRGRSLSSVAKVIDSADIRHLVSLTSHDALAILRQDLARGEVDMESWTKAFKIVADQIRRDHKVAGEKGFAVGVPQSPSSPPAGPEPRSQEPSRLADLRLRIMEEEEEVA